MAFDLLLSGGTLYDGSGCPGRPGDLAIANSRIAAMGEGIGPARGGGCSAIGILSRPRAEREK